MLCALENCNNKVGQNKYEFSYEVDRWLINKPIKRFNCFCSQKCLDGYFEWCVWQKDLGNGIESNPPDYGGQVKNLDGND